MSDIFREIDEAMQRDKAAKMWKEYGPTLLLAAVIMVLATAATTGYRAWKDSQNKEETAKIVTALEDKDTSAALEKAAQNTKGDYKAITLMNAASKKAEAKDFAKAAALYSSVAKDGSTPKDLRDLAVILNARAMIASGATGYKDLADNLAKIAKDNGSTFAAQARLEAASIYGSGLKDYKSAIDMLDGLKDTKAASLKEKADALRHVYSFEMANATSTPAKKD